MPSLFEPLFGHAQIDSAAKAFADAEHDFTRGQFLAAVSTLAGQLQHMPRTVGILMPNGVAWAVTLVAAAAAGKTIVPLPTFFSAAQIAYIVADAGVELILTDGQFKMAETLKGTATLAVHIDPEAPSVLHPEPDFDVVIYTSGSTGTPKGVRLGERQITWSTRALVEASQASRTDRYLSILPLSLLLEMLAAIFVPLSVGGSTYFDRETADAIGHGNVRSLAGVFERHKPTSSVLLPQLLKIWVTELLTKGQIAPGSLRFVAVGGAPVPRSVADRAVLLGIPIHEGYGLSECCSVVAMNRPGARTAGTVGRPLDGLEVTLEDGEIIVSGPSVTAGYLGKADHVGSWRTGDLGHFDESGNLIVLGRKDNLIVTGYGRNVSPEWVETALLSDPRLALACVCGSSDRPLTAVLMPAPAAEPWFMAASEADLIELVLDLTSALPTYARPEQAVALSLATARAEQLITDNGRVRRNAIAAFLSARNEQAA
ncbi:AMP-binding protein [Pleomorphomonas oryzae]|uniref:AMP-binding protein n=1 Tax=Pleomorphomonas oryzae TaxID=261934 RepID=UPI000423B41A|nr:AMP-binding protein [Pleomorphomonas oryzae]